jgi:Ran GTPase-activating protein (RanGAP) involved in mRNA processing and transport
MAHHRNVKDLELSFNKITSVGIGSFIDSIAGYRHLSRLLLDNNKLSGAGAKSLALALPHMQLQELNIGFNEIDSGGLLDVINNVTTSPTLKVVSLSGNSIDSAVAIALSNMLASNVVLKALYLDHTNLSSHGAKSIGSGIARNRKGALQVLTGMDLGKALVQLGSPLQLADMSNEQALKYLVQVWTYHEQQRLEEMRRLSPSNMFNGMQQQGTSFDEQPSTFAAEDSKLIDHKSCNTSSTSSKSGNVPDGSVAKSIAVAEQKGNDDNGNSSIIGTLKIDTFHLQAALVSYHW